MSDLLYYILSAVLVGGVLAGIAMMSRVQSARKGNLLSACCMAAAILLTLFRAGLLSHAGLWVAMAVGLALGALGAARVKMIQMPQAVALLNGLGGAASAIVGVMELINPSVTSVFSSVTAGLAVAVGALTLSGSLVAAAKLHGLIGQRPVVWPAHMALTVGSLVIVALCVVLLALNIAVPAITVLCLLAAGFFGVAFAIRVGGADMPITISLLNAFSGVAAGIAGLAIADPLLVAIGGVVGASGLLLTQIMCRAMNRSLADILLGKTSTATPAKQAAPEEVSVEEAAAEAFAAPVAEEIAEDPDYKAPDVADLLKAAKRVIIAPGYGMAVAQAQEEVKRLSDLLEQNGAEVSFAIHPVAGRMPGHMNVLLAEVDVPYEQLFEMDDINPAFADCDVCLVIGANDVVNPAAGTAEGTPIYGMPVLDVASARHLILCNFDTKPGYAGVENPLYARREGVTLLLGDAKETLAELLEKLL
ncbi:NAD(P)(+) transhydrogenase (Re/Si-specific) subunit beta [Eubacteriales bacterium OttesenSCG-928-A19]|nr:NAD(P)(+) transhydrogenase (Re/Si-specific) subunit beta [Eubacteriales bacterium OttesenSCG-928-A19]